MEKSLSPSLFLSLTAREYSGMSYDLAGLGTQIHVSRLGPS